MSDFEIFDLIQCKVMSMDLDSQISLLNDCLDTLNNLQKSQPEFRNTIKTMLANTCYFDDETYKLFDYIINNCGINSNDILLTIQNGGVGPGEENQLVVQSQDLVTQPPVNDQAISQTSTQFVAQQPSNPLNNISLILQSGTLTPEAQMELIKILGSVAEGSVAVQKAQAEAINSRTRIDEANATWDRRFEKASMFFSFSAPSAAVYFLRSTMDKIAVTTLNTAGTVVSTVAETAELGVRNVLPAVINVGVSLGRQVKGYLPTFLTDLGRAASQSSAAQYATTSAASEIIESATATTTEITSSTILFGSIVFYIALVLLCVVLTTVVNKLRKINKIGFYVGVPGVWSVTAATTDKGGKRKTKRRKHIVKRTRRRHH